MLRSGVPPHMGQSPVPGSDARTTPSKLVIASPPNKRERNFMTFLSRISIRSDREVIQECAELCVEEESWGSFAIADGIDAFDRPCRRLRLSGWPCFALDTHLAAGHVFDTEL